MKILFRLISVLFILFYVSACQKKEELDSLLTTPLADTGIVVSGKSATGFILTWLAATDDTTAASGLYYKVVSSTSNNLTDATTAEANGTVALNWTANTLTTTISSLTNSTTYYFAVLVKDMDGNIGMAGSSVATLCAGKRIFLATATNGNLGGKTGADSICNTQKPSGMGTVKAMLSDNNGINTTTGLPGNTNGRQACWGNCRSSNLYTLDWVIAAGQRYCTNDYSVKVGDAGATYPVLNVPTANVLSSAATNLYAGFDIQYGNSTTNCSNWTTASSSSSFVGGSTAGTFSNSSNTFITGATPIFPDCSTAASLVCVEQ